MKNERIIKVSDVLPLLEGQDWEAVINETYLISDRPKNNPEKFKVIHMVTSKEMKEIDDFIVLFVEEIAD